MDFASMEHDHFEHVVSENLHLLEHVLLTEYKRAREILVPYGCSSAQETYAPLPFETQGPLGKVSLHVSPRQVHFAPEAREMESVNVVRGRVSQDSSASSMTADGRISVSTYTERSRSTKNTERSRFTKTSMISSIAAASAMRNPTRVSSFQSIDPDKFLLFTMTFGHPPNLHEPQLGIEPTVEQRFESPALVQYSSNLALSASNRLTYFTHSFMNLIVFTNIAVIGISTDVWRDWRGWFVVDAVFASIFLVELIVNLKCQGCHEFLYGRERRWNAIEGLLTLLAVGEVFVQVFDNRSDGGGNLSIFRTIRLARVAKILRMLRMEIFTELGQMIEGAMGGLRTLLWSCVLIIIPLYMLAIVFRDTVGKHASEKKGAESFDSLPNAFFTIFRCVVTGDCSTESGHPVFVLVTKNYGWSYAALYFFTTVFCTFGLFNVVIAIFVEKTVAASKTSTLVHKRNRLQNEKLVAAQTKEICQAIARANEIAGLSTSGVALHQRTDYCQLDLAELAAEVSGISITRRVWGVLIMDKSFNDALFDLDITQEDQDELFQTVDADGCGTITAVQLIIAICKLRGDPKRSDVVGVSLMAYHIYTLLRAAKVDTAAILAQQAKSKQAVHQVTPESQHAARCASSDKTVCIQSL